MDVSIRECIRRAHISKNSPFSTAQEQPITHWHAKRTKFDLIRMDLGPPWTPVIQRNSRFIQSWLPRREYIQMDLKSQKAGAEAGLEKVRQPLNSFQQIVTIKRGTGWCMPEKRTPGHAETDSDDSVGPLWWRPFLLPIGVKKLQWHAIFPRSTND